MTFVHATFVLAIFDHNKNISSVTDPILTKFFLGQCSKVANCHGEICLRKIFPHNNCPYQRYIILVWFWPKLFAPNLWGVIIFVGQNVYGPNYLRHKFFGLEIFINPKIFGPVISLDPKFVSNPKICSKTKFLELKIFPDQNFFKHKYF